MEEYNDAKLLLRINNNFYNSIYIIFNIMNIIVLINLSVFSFIFVEIVKNINESFIHGMIMYYIVLGFLSIIIGIICIILLICLVRMQRNTNQNITELNTLISVLNNFIPNDIIQNGLSMEIINKIKTSNEILEDICSICLNKENKEIMMLNCNHNFHSECLLKWLVRNKKCPICRKEVSINDYEPLNILN
jgi:hypothetical protein